MLTKELEAFLFAARPEISLCWWKASKTISGDSAMPEGKKVKPFGEGWNQKQKAIYFITLAIGFIAVMTCLFTAIGWLAKAMV